MQCEHIALLVNVRVNGVYVAHCVALAGPKERALEITRLCESKRGDAPLDTRATPNAPHSAFAAISHLGLHGDVGLAFPHLAIACSAVAVWVQTLRVPFLCST